MTAGILFEEPEHHGEFGSVLFFANEAIDQLSGELFETSALCVARDKVITTAQALIDAHQSYADFARKGELQPLRAKVDYPAATPVAPACEAFCEAMADLWAQLLAIAVIYLRARDAAAAAVHRGEAVYRDRDTIFAMPKS